MCFPLQQFKVQGMGEQCVRAEVLVATDDPNLNLWYPNGYGKPNLYPFEANINLNKVSFVHIFKLLFYSSYTEYCVISGYHREDYWFPSCRARTGNDQ